MPTRLSDRAEAAVLDHLVVRPITPAEQARWEAEVSAHHYLKNALLAGEQMRYVAEHEGRWLAVLGWSAAGLKLADQTQREGRDIGLGAGVSLFPKFLETWWQETLKITGATPANRSLIRSLFCTKNGVHR